MMLEAFEPGTLPGEKSGLHYLPEDVTSFGEIFLAADQSEMECILKHHALGWWPVGKSCTHCTLVTDTCPRQSRPS